LVLDLRRDGVDRGVELRPARADALADPADDGDVLLGLPAEHRHLRLGSRARQAALAVRLPHELRLLEAAVHQEVEGRLGAVELGVLAREVGGDGVAQLDLVARLLLPRGEVAARRARGGARHGADRRAGGDVAPAPPGRRGDQPAEDRPAGGPDHRAADHALGEIITGAVELHAALIAGIRAVIGADPLLPGGAGRNQERRGGEYGNGTAQSGHGGLRGKAGGDRTSLPAVAPYRKADASPFLDRGRADGAARPRLSPARDSGSTLWWHSRRSAGPAAG
jgi:hypothetical protein